jgi:electron transfer flavoprotein alpha/beta subunit
MEHLDISLPALCTIQTGINEPRYASLIAIRRAAKKEIEVEFLTGSPGESAGKLANIFKEKGLI